MQKVYGLCSRAHAIGAAGVVLLMDRAQSPRVHCCCCCCCCCSDWKPRAVMVGVREAMVAGGNPW